MYGVNAEGGKLDKTLNVVDNVDMSRYLVNTLLSSL